MNSDLYGFFPGFGPLQRIRHKFSPSLNWTYSPEVTASDRLSQLRGFNPGDVREQHQLSVGLNQTFEAKLKPRKELEDTAAAAADSAPAGPPPEARKITLMALRTTALTYDFVKGELITDRISNNITSDLLRGLTIRVQHDLFEETESGRNFDPFLTQLNLTFSLGARTFGGPLGEPSAGVRRGRGIVPLSDEFEDEELRPEEEPDAAEPAARARRRPWNLGLDYSLVRFRPVVGGTTPNNRQSVRANLGFSPTDNWTVTWRTQFDIEEREFVDQALSLRRDLHRWSATFEFLKAANGNFLFEFRVNLNDLQDIKFDYRQESRSLGN